MAIHTRRDIGTNNFYHVTLTCSGAAGSRVT